MSHLQILQVTRVHFYQTLPIYQTLGQVFERNVLVLNLQKVGSDVCVFISPPVILMYREVGGHSPRLQLCVQF